MVYTPKPKAMRYAAHHMSYGNDAGMMGECKGMGESREVNGMVSGRKRDGATIIFLGFFLRPTRRDAGNTRVRHHTQGQLGRTIMTVVRSVRTTARAENNSRRKK